jgi:MFS superfamily sulfate permease-like transporter
MDELNKKALGGLLRFLIILAVLLFLPAWTFRYWQAWIFLFVFSACALAISLYVMKNDPKLLEECGQVPELRKSGRNRSSSLWQPQHSSRCFYFRRSIIVLGGRPCHGPW